MTETYENPSESQCQPTAMTFVCKRCGQTHEGLPGIAFDQPWYAHDVPRDQRSERVQLTDDLCIVDNEYYFIRGVILIPIRDYPEPLVIGAWVSQKKENYDTYVNNIDSADIGPFFGWLSNEFLFGGESAAHLKTMVHFQGSSERPHIQLEPTEHPLAMAQTNGLSLDEAVDFVHPYLDGSESRP